MMKVLFQIKSAETGLVLLRQRKISKALRRWLYENKISFEYEFYIPRSYYFIQSKNL